MKRRPPKSTLFPYKTLFRSKKKKYIKKKKKKKTKEKRKKKNKKNKNKKQKTQTKKNKKHRERKSTRLNTSHVANPYDIFCFKKKNQQIKIHQQIIHHHTKTKT